MHTYTNPVKRHEIAEKGKCILSTHIYIEIQLQSINFKQKAHATTTTHIDTHTPVFRPFRRKQRRQETRLCGFLPCEKTLRHNVVCEMMIDFPGTKTALLKSDLIETKINTARGAKEKRTTKEKRIKERDQNKSTKTEIETKMTTQSRSPTKHTQCTHKHKVQKYKQTESAIQANASRISPRAYNLYRKAVDESEGIWGS